MSNPFEIVPDPVSKAAFEEIFIPGEFKTVLGTYAPPADVVDPGLYFPPEPAELLTISAAYLRDGAPTGIKQEFLGLSSRLPSTNAAVRMYRTTVDRRQDMLPLLLSLTSEIPDFESGDAIRKFCVDAVRANRTHLLAAHLIAKGERDGQLMDALILPRRVSEDLPRVLWSAFEQKVARHDPNDPALTDLAQLKSEGSDREPAAIAAAGFLPRSHALRHALDQTRRHRRGQR